MNKIISEQNLSQHFCSRTFNEVIGQVSIGRSVNLISSPGVGTSLFMKYLLTHWKGKIIYLDCDHFGEETIEEFQRQFLKALGVNEAIGGYDELLRVVDKKLMDVLQSEERIVVAIAHFDLLKKVFGKELFDLIKYIRATKSNHFSFIFNTRLPLTELLQNRLTKINTNIIGETLYLRPYNREDCEDIVKNILHMDVADDKIKRAIELSGGNFYLLSLLSWTKFEDRPLNDPIIKMYFKRILDSLSGKRKRMLERVVTGKSGVEVDEYLLNVGLVTLDDQRRYHLFTPLFDEYIRKNSQLKLSASERRLFQLLKQKLGKIINKDDIIVHVWGVNNDASDWALNSMIYRIRNNPVFKEQGYEIESFKKIGYKLIKN